MKRYLTASTCGARIEQQCQSRMRINGKWGAWTPISASVYEDNRLRPRRYPEVRIAFVAEISEQDDDVFTLNRKEK